jgi:hypothetical protein
VHGPDDLGVGAIHAENEKMKKINIILTN